jgi:hypothetical protein
LRRPAFRGIVLAGFGVVAILAGCGGQAEIEAAANSAGREADQIPKIVHPPDLPDNTLPDVLDLAKPNHLGNGDGLGRPGNPQPGAAALAITAGKKAGHDAQAAGHRLAEDTRLTPEEQKELTCFLTEKAIAGELPHSAGGVAVLVGEYFGEDLAEHIPAYKFVQASDDLYDIAEELADHGGVSTENAISIVCG